MFTKQELRNSYRKSDSEKLNTLYRFLEAQYTSGSLSQTQYEKTLEILSE